MHWTIGHCEREKPQLSLSCLVRDQTERRKPACTLALSPARSRIKSSQRSTLISDHHLTICQRGPLVEFDYFFVNIFNSSGHPVATVHCDKQIFK